MQGDGGQGRRGRDARVGWGGWGGDIMLFSSLDTISARLVDL